MTQHKQLERIAAMLETFVKEGADSISFDALMPDSETETLRGAVREAMNTVPHRVETCPDCIEKAKRSELFTLSEAARILNGPRPTSGEVTPETPFGQATRTLPDGRKVSSVTGEITGALEDGIYDRIDAEMTTIETAIRAQRRRIVILLEQAVDARAAIRDRRYDSALDRLRLGTATDALRSIGTETAWMHGSPVEKFNAMARIKKLVYVGLGIES